MDLRWALIYKPIVQYLIEIIVTVWSPYDQPGMRFSSYPTHTLPNTIGEPMRNDIILTTFAILHFEQVRIRPAALRKSHDARSTQSRRAAAETAGAA